MFANPFLDLPMELMNINSIEVSRCLNSEKVNISFEKKYEALLKFVRWT